MSSEVDQDSWSHKMSGDTYERRDSTDSGFAEIDFLMPHGFVVPLKCDRRMSFGSVKDLLWKEALKLPASSHLRNSSQYVFVGVTRDALERVLDDVTPVHAVEDLIANVVEVSEPPLEREWRRLVQQLGQAVGLPVDQLDETSSYDVEHKDVRIHLKRHGERVAKERESWQMDTNLKFFFPPNFDTNQDLPIATARKMAKETSGITVNIKVLRDGQHHTFDVRIMPTDSPFELVAVAMNAIKSNPDKTLRATILRSSRRPSESDSETIQHVLKRCDCEEFLLEERQLHTYEYIRNCINRGQTPQLQLVEKESLRRRVPDNKCVSLQEGMPTLKSPSDRCLNYTSSWHLTQNCYYQIKVRQMPLDRCANSEYYIEAQIFHGDQALCPPITTDEQGFNRPWVFEIAIDSLPRAARLCFTICHRHSPVDKRGHKWMNLQIFDHHGRLVTGIQKSDAWDFPETIRRYNNPLGTPGYVNKRNYNRLEFEIMCPPNITTDNIVYPGDLELLELIEREQKYQQPEPVERSFIYLDRIVEKEVLTPLTSKEKEELWKYRHLALDYRQSLLPRIIQCVDWTQRHQVFQLYQLLDGHKLESVTVALQLLGPEYPDAWVRRLAVEYIDRHLTPELLDLYLLQLVQCLKFESYQHNELVALLLRRALVFKTIGHHFFWHLRSEMHNQLSQHRFAPILESYCMYCGSAILAERLKEVQAVESLFNLARGIKTAGEKLEEPQRMAKQSNLMRQVLEQQSKHGDLQNTTALLNKNVEMGDLQLAKCKVMRSKMRPEWLSWSNNSPCAGPESSRVDYIVKEGDDLRQDMLVLQLLKVMDMLWKYSCHDYWMTIYDCMSTGENFGIIEAVRDTMTICDIELDNTTQFISTKSMHAWIYQTTGGGEQYLKAVKRFTYSCAAYTVAAYLLGIGDRHSDNIMMKDKGEMFHIDFGHFMGHKKSKAGIKRERLPFVITKEFMTVIARGDIKGNKDVIVDFLFLCYEAFMTIRQNGTLFLTLLNLMKHCNLPELNCDLDLQYCRDCLGLDKPEHEVAKDFYRKFMVSYRNGWMTNLNWFFHRFHRVMQISNSSES